MCFKTFANGKTVDRLFLEMQKARLTTPMYEVNSFMLNDTIFNIKNVENSVGNNVGENVGEKLNSAKRVFLN